MKTIKTHLAHPEFFLGIDVGKADLHCHFIGPLHSRSESFSNNPDGIKRLTHWLLALATAERTVACLEQTGHYGRALSKALHRLNLHNLFLVNPRQIKAFGHQKLRRNKSDSADAKLIAQFLKSEHLELHPWTPRDTQHEQIKELSRYADGLTQDTAKLKTKCEAALHPPVLRSLKRRIKSQLKELADIRSRIDRLIDQNQTFLAQKDLLLTIPGLGKVSCQTLLAELPDLALFSNARQLAAWAGLTPQHYVSGTSGRTTTPITKIGSAYLRRALFMPAMNARVFNPLLKEFGDRLIENGKKPKQVIIAIMRKLLHQVYGILKSNQPYQPEKRGFGIPANA